MKSIIVNKTIFFKLLVIITLVSYIFSFKFLANEPLDKPDIKDRYKSNDNSTSSNSSSVRAPSNSTNSNSGSTSSSSPTSSSSSSSSATSTANSSSTSNSASTNNGTSQTSPNNTADNTNNNYQVAKVINPSAPPALVQKTDFYNTNIDCPVGSFFDQYSGACAKGLEGQTPPNDFILMQGIHKGTNIEYVDRFKGYKTPTIVNNIGADWKYYDRKAGSSLK